MDDDRSLFYEEFSPGDVFLGESRTVTEKDLEDYAQLSGDYNPLHMDSEFAAGTPYGMRIAHGVYGLSAATGMAASLGFARSTTIAFRNLEWKFNRPIFIGDTIQAVFSVSRKRDLLDQAAGLIIFLVTVENQRKEIVQSGKWSLVVKSRQA